MSLTQWIQSKAQTKSYDDGSNLNYGHFYGNFKPAQIKKLTQELDKTTATIKNRYDRHIRSYTWQDTPDSFCVIEIDYDYSSVNYKRELLVAYE